MTAKDFQRVRELFDLAMDQPRESRLSFIESACGEDAALLDAVQRLVRAREKAGILDTPIRERRETSQPAALPGTFLGPYRVLQQLSAGGMGMVYQAVRDDEVFRRICAIKVIRPELCNDWLVDRFRNERQILGQLDHVNIARIVDGGTTPEGLPYFVMDYVEGAPIDRFCSQHHLGERPRLALLQQACAAVEYIHRNGVIHGDLKPSNILVGHDGVVKLVDFGIASTLEVQDEQMRNRLQLLMTPSYASPEQQRGEPLTPASDIYCLGIVLFEMMTGQRPFRSSHLVAGSCANAWMQPASVDAVPSTAEGHNGPATLNHDLNSIALHALASDPAKRYPSAAAMKEDIARYLDGRAVSVRKGAFYIAGRFLSRNRRAVIAWLVIAILLPTAVWACVVAHRRKVKADSLQNQVQILQTRMAKESDEYRRKLASVSGTGASVEERRQFEQTQLQDLDRLAHAYRTNFTESVRVWPGLTRSRRALLDQADSYLQQADAMASGSEVGREKLAAAWLWLANLEGNPQRVNLHDRAAALDSMRQAQRLADTLRGDSGVDLARQVQDAQQQIQSAGQH